MFFFSKFPKSCSRTFLYVSTKLKISQITTTSKLQQQVTRTKKQQDWVVIRDQQTQSRTTTAKEAAAVSKEAKRGLQNKHLDKQLGANQMQTYKLYLSDFLKPQLFDPNSNYWIIYKQINFLKFWDSGE